MTHDKYPRTWIANKTIIPPNRQFPVSINENLQRTSSFSRNRVTTEQRN